MLLPSVKEPSAAREVAARLRAAVAEPIRLEGMSFVIEVSIGIAMFPEDATGDELLMQRADVAMYLAKQRRSGVERYVADLDRNSPARLALFGELRRGLDRGELELHYQPKIYLADRSVAGVEALIRWRHPVRGMLTPDDFIPLVQQSYLMREVTAFVIETSVAQAALWRQAGFDLQMSLNVSGRDLLDTGLAEPGHRMPGQTPAARERAAAGDRRAGTDQRACARRRHRRGARRDRHRAQPRRLRHRLFLAGPAQAAAGERGQGRFLVREQAAGVAR